MSAPGWIVGCVIVFLATGCYRTVYRHLEPPGEAAHIRVVAPRSHAWRSFLLYGWVPRERVVHAAAECGGASDRGWSRSSRQARG